MKPQKSQQSLIFGETKLKGYTQNLHAERQEPRTKIYMLKDRTPWLVRLDGLWGQYSNQSPRLFLNSSSKFQNTTNICRHPWLPKTYVCTHTKSKLIECDSWLGMSKQHSNSRTEIPHCDCTHPRGSWAIVWIAVSLPPPQPPWRIQVWLCLTSLLFSEWCQDSEGQVG